MKKIILLLFIICLWLFFPLAPVCAQAGSCACPSLAGNPPSCSPCVYTALGCINPEPTCFVAWILARAIGIGGGIAFLLIIFGAIKILTSAGNPENVKAGQEMITSAVMGLLFIIFSLFLLELIGVKILNIPGFSTP